MSCIDAEGSLRKVIGVLKTHAGGFENTLREFVITPEGMQVGDTVTEFSGVVQGQAQFGTGDS